MKRFRLNPHRLRLMSFLNSEALLDLLVTEQLLTVEQRNFIVLHKGKQRQKLLKLVRGRRQEDDESKLDKDYPDLVDIIASLDLETGGPKKMQLTEELIMRTVSQGFKIPFKKLDPLELDMNIVTKTIYILCAT